MVGSFLAKTFLPINFSFLRLTNYSTQAIIKHGSQNQSQELEDVPMRRCGLNKSHPLEEIFCVACLEKFFRESYCLHVDFLEVSPFFH